MHLHRNKDVDLNVNTVFYLLLCWWNRDNIPIFASIDRSLSGDISLPKLFSFFWFTILLDLQRRSLQFFLRQLFNSATSIYPSIRDLLASFCISPSLSRYIHTVNLWFSRYHHHHYNLTTLTLLSKEAEEKYNTASHLIRDSVRCVKSPQLSPINTSSRKTGAAAKLIRALIRQSSISLIPH